MAERDACLTVSASTWFEIIGGVPASDLSQYEYMIRCRVVVEGSLIVIANIYEVADTPGRFRRLAFAPALGSIPKYQIIRDEPWDRDEPATVDPPAPTGE